MFIKISSTRLREERTKELKTIHYTYLVAFHHAHSPSKKETILHFKPIHVQVRSQRVKYS